MVTISYELHVLCMHVPVDNYTQHNFLTSSQVTHFTGQ